MKSLVIHLVLCNARWGQWEILPPWQATQTISAKQQRPLREKLVAPSGGASIENGPLNKKYIYIYIWETQRKITVITFLTCSIFSTTHRWNSLQQQYAQLCEHQLWYIYIFYLFILLLIPFKFSVRASNQLQSTSSWMTRKHSYTLRQELLPK